ncbi:MAG TPA: aldo/keto reductase [Casimicrobiaceae bacterium]|nr:aldo/keto reductase [Casimicrobiaceae bacterium]
MPETLRSPRRRDVLRACGAIALPVWTRGAAAQAPAPIVRAIPASGETLPAIGVGSWITFNVPPDTPAAGALVPVLATFFERGGAMIDSSPMYGYSETVIGGMLRNVPHPRLFSATKIWTIGEGLGRMQFERSLELWGLAKFDLVHIHNLLDWETHLPTLKELKAAGRLRYIGVTTSEGNKHEEMERALSRERFDFVQLTYNFADRRVEERLLPLAAERGAAVVVNRPFDGGRLFRAVNGRTLPAWASEFDCRNWAQFFLKFVLSHPSISCAIPATHQTAHMVENMGALYGRLPDARTRSRMVQHMEML